MAEPAIAASGLVKRYGDVVALDGIDLAVPAGTVLGLLGPNGAGKTTAVRILTTVLRADAGTARLMGIDVFADPQSVRETIGLAGQYAAVDENLTGRENLVMVGRLTHLSKDVSRRRAGELLDRFGLTDAADRTAKTYSGGMRRRLDLAAALVHRPPVLFLDEPTTGLDPRSRSDLWGVIEELVADGATLLLTSQYLEEVDRLADNIVVIDHGRVIAEGTAAQLKSRLGTTIAEVTLAPAADRARALAVLGQLGEASAPADDVVAVTVPDNGPSIVELVRLVDREGIAIAGLAVREPTLDDVFLQLTGRPTDAEEPPSTAPPTGRGGRGRRRKEVAA